MKLLETDTNSDMKTQIDEDEVVVLSEGKRNVVLAEVTLEDEDGEDQTMAEMPTEVGDTSEHSNSTTKPTRTRELGHVHDGDTLEPLADYDRLLQTSTLQGNRAPSSALYANNMKFDIPVRIKLEPQECPDTCESLGAMCENNLSHSPVGMMRSSVIANAASPAPSPPASVSEPVACSSNLAEIDVVVCEKGNYVIILKVESFVIWFCLSETRSSLMNPVIPGPIRINISPPGQVNQLLDSEKTALVKQQTTFSTPPCDEKNEEELLQQELLRTKPRLAGRKLTVYPPKETAGSDSALCTIC